MPRHARLRLDGYPLHIMQRGNNRGLCFRSDAERVLYLSLLEQFGRSCDCRVHAYVLMTNHVHLLVTPQIAAGVSQFMKDVTQRYVQFVNRSHKRTGSLWEGRFRSSIVDSEAYLLRCHRYIELNPVRAGMVAHPRDYAWSSYRVNAEGEFSTLIEPHSLYLDLGRDAVSRRVAYRRLFEDEPTQREIEQIRAASRGSFALGGETFLADLERQLGTRVVSTRRKAAKDLRRE